MTGHAYGHPTSWIAQSLHILGFGLWLGTLAVALIAPSRPLSSGDSSTAARQRWLGAFAPLAGTGAITVIASGVVLSLTSIPSWSSLLHTGYGQVYLIKVALVGVIGALGARNFRALRGGVGAGLGRAAGIEAMLALLVLLVTAILTSLPQPDMVH
jgi:putative copper export protein